jgi:competence protein ComEA
VTRRPGPLLQAWAMATLALLVRAAADGALARARPPSCLVASHRLAANAATVEQWTALPGCGRARAEAIVVARIRGGPFRSAQDLLRVDGVGAAFVASVAPWLDFGSPSRDRP